MELLGIAAALAVAIATIGPGTVAYTHLDVYKRQRGSGSALRQYVFSLSGGSQP